MTNQNLKILAITIRSLCSDSESPDFIRGVNTVSIEIAWQLKKDFRCSSDKSRQKADNFLAMCRM